MLAHFGTFDVANFGDLLFPLLVKKKMASLGIECVHISPTGMASIWRDALPSISILEARQREHTFTSIIIGGGNILRTSATSLPIYVSLPSSIERTMTYPALWQSAFSAASRRRIPLCWNAVGVSRPISTSADWIHRGARLSAYISVRDSHSRATLQDGGVSEPIRVVPDTALGIRELWSRSEISDAYAHLWDAASIAVPQRILAVSIKRKYLTIGHSELGSVLDNLATSLNATPVLLALGPCHGDLEIARSVAQYMNTKPFIPIPRFLVEIAACIAHAVHFVGSSLHGAITAAAFGVPFTIVANEQVVPFRKFSGFLQQIGMDDALVSTWEDLADPLRINNPLSPAKRSLTSALTTLNAHWLAMTDALGVTKGRGDL